jgi:tRNA (adenine57-N1/adenine58-N1)-methyltransferase
MDFARPHIRQESVATRSKIRYIPVVNKENPSLDDKLVEAANQAAVDLFLGSGGDPESIDSSLYPECVTPQTETIQANQLVVIFESFDNLDFCYAKNGAIFSNRNGHFHHDEFIGKPYGCKIRSTNNRGYGFVYLLKPTPELWARSLNHRTQIIHELDASMIVFYLNLRPNMVVCESGTGSGALSHCILRTIAPQGHLYTYEFNKMRAESARQEFAKNRVDHLVTVYHKDVCGKQLPGGFDRPHASVDATVLDLPEPWLAVPHAAYCLKPNGRIASYSPCVEQSQRTLAVLKECGFHSMKTMEFRLKEHYVDEVEYELAPREKRPRIEASSVAHLVAGGGTTSGGEDTGAEADNEKSEYETEGDQASLATAEGDQASLATAAAKVLSNPTAPTGAAATTTPKCKKLLVARPFVTMRGHTAFLTFATAGNKPQPDPLQLVSKTESSGMSAS